MSDGNKTGHATQSAKRGKIRSLLRELSEDEDEALDIGLDIANDPQRPWLQDYQAYMNVVEQIPDGWTAVKWWGVSLSICFDFLSDKV